jgi:epoxyqueuosine reductase
MDKPADPELNHRIIDKAKELGASLAGIATLSSLKNAPSYEVYDKSPYYERYERILWPGEDIHSVLVLALVHDPSEPELDWWRTELPGRTLGNQRLMVLADELRDWLIEDFDIRATPLSYYVEEGGIFLKDASVLAGLGTIGKNNLLITPEYGPRVRLRALCLDVELEATGPIDFNPCVDCPMPCQLACPQNAFQNGSYSRDTCDLQMGEDEASQEVFGTLEDGKTLKVCRRYCRECELACPVPIT